MFRIAALLIMTSASVFADEGIRIEGISPVEPAGFTSLREVNGANRCESGPAGLSKTRTDALCEPDPYEGLCASIPADECAAEKSIRKRARKMHAQLLGRGGKLTGPELTKQKDLVRSRFREVLEAYRGMLEDRPMLSQQSRELLVGMMKACEDQFEVSLLDKDVERSAADVMQSFVWMQSGRKKDDYLGALKNSHSCSVQLSARGWLECVEGSADCYWTLAHELGHLLNSCQYLGHASNWSGAGLPKSRGQLSTLGLDLSVATECLKVISEPRNGIPSQCETEKSFIPEPELAHCGFNAARGFPSQWNEAQADLWGTSAFARVEAKRSSDPAVRRRRVAEMLRVECLGARKLDASCRPAAPADHGHSHDEALDRHVGRKWDPENGDPSLTCDLFPAASALPLPPRWNDTHQPWSHRINRNVLRNADLRDVIACPVDGAVPVACAPGRSIRFVIPESKSR